MWKKYFLYVVTVPIKETKWNKLETWKINQDFQNKKIKPHLNVSTHILYIFDVYLSMPSLSISEHI